MPDGQRPSKTPELVGHGCFRCGLSPGQSRPLADRKLATDGRRLCRTAGARRAPAALAAALALRRRSTTSSAAGWPAGAAPCGRPRAGSLEVPLTVRWYRGTTVDVTLGNDNSLCLYVCGSFEPNEFAFLDQVLRPGMVFFDVGANDGYYTLFAAQKVGTAGACWRSSPAPASAPTSSATSTRNGLGNVTVVPAGAGRRLRHRPAPAGPGRPFRPQHAGRLRQRRRARREHRAGAGADPR